MASFGLTSLSDATTAHLRLCLHHRNLPLTAAIGRLNTTKRLLCTTASHAVTETAKETTTADVKPTAIAAAAQSLGSIARVVLKRGKAALFKDGHPMVYSGAIDRVVGRPQPKSGDPVVVTDGAETPIAWGIFNPDSMYRVRIMQLLRDAERSPDVVLNIDALLEERINAAVALRKQLGLPSQETSVFRLINSEGDKLSGLIVDALGDHLVVSSSAAWVERYKPSVLKSLQKATGVSNIVWRPATEMLKEEGMTFGDDAVVAENQEVEGPFVEVLDNGTRFRACLSGQKTGFYADQRDSRLLIRQLSRGCSLLDLCCYSGAFAVAAAVGGARQVLGVDTSADAIQLAQSNAALNGLNSDQCTFERAEAVKFMQGALDRGEKWDMIVLDPPKLAPNRKSLGRAEARYRKLNSLAMRLVAPGGLLMTCSCSGAMAQGGRFLPMLQESAATAGKQITILRIAGAAPDHTQDPAYPEGAYLTNVLLRVV